jgi:hypothetical protein
VQSIAFGTGQADLRVAAENLAAAMQAVGLDRWPRFLADAQRKATDGQGTRVDPTTPVVFTDDTGEVILDSKGDPMQRPAGLDPHFFVEQGVKDKEIMEQLLSGHGSEGEMAAGAYQMGQLAQFNRGAPWDAQRVGGRYHPEFVDYATVAIGLYAAASGMSRESILRIEDMIARTSHFDPQIRMDRTYVHLPARNVWNTDKGFELYRSGHIAALSQ